MKLFHRCYACGLFRFAFWMKRVGGFYHRNRWLCGECNGLDKQWVSIASAVLVGGCVMGGLFAISHIAWLRYK